MIERNELEAFDAVPAVDAPPPFESDLTRTPVTEADQRRVRDELRRQIARMEAELARLFGEAFPRLGIEWGVAAAGGPRILDVAELESVRDRLADRLADVRGELHSRAYVEERHRELIEEMVADPAAHKWIRVSNEAIGEPGCRSWHSRPRWGVLGMLMGWWRVKLSSGCPLAAGLAAPVI